MTLKIRHAADIDRAQKVLVGRDFWWLAIEEWINNVVSPKIEDMLTHSTLYFGEPYLDVEFPCVAGLTTDETFALVRSRLTSRGYEVTLEYDGKIRISWEGSNARQD